MTHVWGTTKSNVVQSSYISVISLGYNDAMASIRFEVLSKYLATAKKEMTIEETLLDRELIGIIYDILDGMSRNAEESDFIYELVDKRYIRFMAFYSDLLDGDKLNVAARLKALDDVYENADKDLVVRFPELNEDELKRLNENVARLLGIKNHYNSQRLLKESLSSFSYMNLERDKYREPHLLESVYYIWFVNAASRWGQDGKTNKIFAYSITEDELSQTILKFKSDSQSQMEIYVENASVIEETHKAINYFFQTMNKIMVDAIENSSLDNKGNELFKLKKEFFMKVWTAMRKDTSLWMVPSGVYEKLMTD